MTLTILLVVLFFKPILRAVGLINESTENRRVKDEVISKLRQLGHTVYDCTVDNGTGQTDVLKKIIANKKWSELNKYQDEAKKQGMNIQWEIL